MGKTGLWATQARRQPTVGFPKTPIPHLDGVVYGNGVESVNLRVGGRHTRVARQTRTAVHQTVLQAQKAGPFL